MLDLCIDWNSHDTPATRFGLQKCGVHVSTIIRINFECTNTNSWNIRKYSVQFKTLLFLLIFTLVFNTYFRFSFLSFAIPLFLHDNWIVTNRKHLNHIQVDFWWRCCCWCCRCHLFVCEYNNDFWCDIQTANTCKRNTSNWDERIHKDSPPLKRAIECKAKDTTLW